jgi:LDH2 family malate/lactate/ureidoglycolate dehydrogenase
MLNAMLRDDGVRLPGMRRQKLATAAQAQGVSITDAQVTELLVLSGKKSI